MTTNLPAWALIQATPADRLRTKQAYEQGNMQTNWDTAVALKGCFSYGITGNTAGSRSGCCRHVDGETLNSFGRFYNWAHNRYHALEDGHDSWIGDDI